MLSVQEALDLIPRVTHKMITEITAPNLNLPSSALPIRSWAAQRTENTTQKESTMLSGGTQLSWTVSDHSVFLCASRISRKEMGRPLRALSRKTS